MIRGWRVRLVDHPHLLHLRLGFNLLLTPVFLWGVFLAGGGMQQPGFWLGYVSLHIFLYGGTTAFNSYYDRDEGPIGGMLEPPPVDEGLLRFSLVVQALGLIPAALTGLPFLLGWLALFLVFAAYSHPVVRLKARPASALTAIAIGQGALGFALGWLSVRDLQGLFGPAGTTGMVATSLVVTGLYIVTQSYQAAEDRGRGDRTLAVIVGARRSLLLALLPLAVGGSLVAVRIGLRLDWLWASGLLLFFALLGTWLVLWATHFEEGEVEGNFRTAMRFTTIASCGLTALLLFHIAAG